MTSMMYLSHICSASTDTTVLGLYVFVWLRMHAASHVHTVIVYLLFFPFSWLLVCPMHKRIHRHTIQDLAVVNTSIKLGKRKF